jgi:hypothetical protein
MFIMHQKYVFARILIVIFSSLWFSACANTQQAGASKAIEGYFEALIAKDLNRLINHSCTAWEAEARQELRTFDAVEASLKDLSCQEGAQDEDYVLVSCTGQIIANYGNEILEINLAERTYRAKYEDGEWRMCGYR